MHQDTLFLDKEGDIVTKDPLRSGDDNRVDEILGEAKTLKWIVGRGKSPHHLSFLPSIRLHRFPSLLDPQKKLTVIAAKHQPPDQLPALLLRVQSGVMIRCTSRLIKANADQPIYLRLHVNANMAHKGDFI